jgi:hypothetical protein
VFGGTELLAQEPNNAAVLTFLVALQPSGVEQAGSEGLELFCPRWAKTRLERPEPIGDLLDKVLPLVSEMLFDHFANSNRSIDTGRVIVEHLMAHLIVGRSLKGNFE